MSINRVYISGNLTRDPEMRNCANGSTVIGFGVAVNDRVKNQQTGQWEDRPNFIDCTMFGNRASSLQQYLHKGDKVAIEGHLRWSQWERNGEKRSKLEVIVDEIELMSQRQQQAQAAQYGQPVAVMPQHAYQQPQAPQQQAYMPQYQQGYQAQYQQQQAPQQASVYDEDIPF